MTQRVGIPTASQVAGDVFSSFQRLNNIISKNDGIRQFSILTNNCYDSDQGLIHNKLILELQMRCMILTN